MHVCAKFSCDNFVMFVQYFDYYSIILTGGGVFRGHGVDANAMLCSFIAFFYKYLWILPFLNFNKF